ncbi:M23 family metallopeptidase [Bacillus pseudomycoides]|uniref:M23 family metallopeptidase n=1 Tax=Bacillus pseudomycoides TaxID=64104 RepID=UPI002B493510|nr:M23 family metallopeptidase [Bacillus pseudomycoides]MEB3054848.1 M23 family metallopeptidase [Bacillus pseudomycoides]
MWKKIILTIFVAILLIGWSLIYVARGIVSIFAWWGIQAFSFFSIVIFIITMTTIIWILFSRRRIDKTIIFILILSVAGAWPAGWFVGIGQIAYPADVHSATPKATIRLPLNQTALVGWGGNRLETNYHAWAPNQRWAYDFLVPPAGIKSSKLEDYGIYGAEVVAPASGTVISINTDEPDLKPGTDDFDSMAGNHIYFRLDETGTYLILAHLKRGSVLVKEGQHINEGTVVAKVGNSGNSSEPHLHIHHQRQDPSKTSMFLSEGLPLYFRDIDGHAMPEGGIRVKNGNAVPIGDVISPLT